MVKKEITAKNIGLDVQPPKNKCNDLNCPFHGNIKIRGRIFKGKVIQADVHNSVVVEWPRSIYLYKYERFEKRRTKIKAHNPPCIAAEIGDTVKIGEVRPISKTKKFVIFEKVK